MSVVIVGGGIAGLACAWHLARSGRKVTVLEREPLVFSHASGRNAAIFRPLEESEPLVELAERSRLLLQELRGDTPLLDEVGLLLTAADHASLEPLRQTAVRTGLNHQLLSGSEIVAQCPLLENGRSHHAIFVPHGGVLDLRGLAYQLRRRASDLGAQFICDEEVVDLTVRGGAVKGVRTLAGVSIFASEVVLAAGAWSQALAASVGLAFPLMPHRRHLAYVDVDIDLPERLPITWDIELGSYFRAERGGLLASPGDHVPHPPGIPNTDPSVLVELQARLSDMCPVIQAPRIQQAWACLRTLTHDGHMVLGRDERLAGFHWLAGLGGHGMSAGLAAGELVARGLAGHDDPLLRHFVPERWGPG